MSQSSELSDILEPEQLAEVALMLQTDPSLLSSSAYFNNMGFCHEEYSNTNDYKLPLTYMVPPHITSENEAGPFNFEVIIDNKFGVAKNNWIFSDKLNKLFVTMNSTFVVHYKYDFNTNRNLFVRTKPVFQQTQFSNDLVRRCLQHSHALDSTNTGASNNIIHHIMWCENKDAMYEGNVDEKSHLNVKVPLGSPESGVDSVTRLYKFMCKNSCAGRGMNRRPINVIFTLEDEMSQIWARKVFGVRICSCPKRDKEKEEKEYNKLHDVPTNSAPQGKKRKMEAPPPSASATADTDIVKLSLQIVGKANAQAVLKYAHDLMSGDMVRTGQEQPYKTVMNDISSQMN